MFTWFINIFKGKKNKVNQNIHLDPNGVQINIDAKHTPEDPRKVILKESRDRLNKLSILMNWFDLKKITDIYNQSLMIHEIFEKNDQLTYKKLDQYHYMYTDALIELLDKIKKETVQNIGVLNTKIEVIDNKIETSIRALNKINTSVNTNIKNQYSEYMSLQLSTIYNCLIDGFNDFRYKKSKDFKFFNYREDDAFFWVIDNDTFNKVTTFNKTSARVWEDYVIENKLLGKLNKYLFLITFEGCFVTDTNDMIELFKLNETGDYFIYDVKNYSFNLINKNDLTKFMSENNTKYAEMKQDVVKLKDSKQLINNELKIVKKKAISKDVNTLLDQYLVKIEDVSFVENLETINVETLNLKTLLELERLDI